MIEAVEEPAIEDLYAARVRLGTNAAAGKLFGLSKSAVQKRLKRAQRRGRLPTPKGHDWSSLYITERKTIGRKVERADGTVFEWEKLKLDDRRAHEAREAACRAMCGAIPPARPIPRPRFPRGLDPAWLNVYTVTDAHVGMYATARETGDDWSIEIAEAALRSAFRHMIETAPPAKTCAVVLLGDFLHFDGLLAVTPNSRHVLDASGRYPELVALSIRILREMVATALSRHGHVHLVICEGNHDEASSVWIREMAKVLWEREPRINVVGSMRPFYALTHGRVMLGWHHGHLVKPKDLPMWFAANRADDWAAGRAERVIHCGHRHHHDEKDQVGARVLQHPTLAAMDAHGSRCGFGGGATPRALRITYDADIGEVDRGTTHLHMFRPRQADLAA